MPSYQRSMDIVGSKLIVEQTHKTTKNTIKLDQRVDRNLLIAIYENGRQILQNRVDEFGPCANENQRLPENDETILKAFAFMRPIFDMYVKNEINKDEILTVKNKLIAEHRGQLNGEKARSRGSKAQSKKPERTSEGSNGTRTSNGSEGASKQTGPSKGSLKKPTSTKSQKKKADDDEEKETIDIDDAEDDGSKKKSKTDEDKSIGERKSSEYLQIKMPPIQSTIEILEILLIDPDHEDP